MHTHTHTCTHTQTCTRTYTQNTGTHIHTSPPLSLNLHMSNANICLTQNDQDNVVSNRPKHKALSLNQTVSPQTVHTLVVVLKDQCERNFGITCSRHCTYSLASNSLRKGYIVMPYSTETKPTQRVMFHTCHTPLKPNQHRESCFTSVIRHWNQTNTESHVSQVSYATETKPTQRVMFHKCHTPLKPNQHRESCFTSVIRH